MAGRSRPLQLTQRFLTVAHFGRSKKNVPTTPDGQQLPSITSTWFSLIRFRSPLLTESLLFSLPVGTEMFHFPTFPPHTLYIQMRVTRHHSCWVSPFGNPRISARLTAPRGLSQPPTSFIGSWCQGIHRTLLNTYKQRCSRPLCSSQTTHKTETPYSTSTSEEAGMTAAQSRRYLAWKERLFSQDPTVCRYIHPPTRHVTDRYARKTCQRSTHEHPQSHCRRLNGLCQARSNLC